MSRSGNTPNTIVHVGAGTGNELDEWLASGATRVILVEPNPERARELATRAAADDRIEVVQKAVGVESGQLRLKRFNLPALSSLREPTGLLELFPGLRTEREIDVDAITPAELLESVSPEDDSGNWLIIDTPGEEAAIVNALHTADQLAHFSRLILHCGTDPLYADNAPAATLLDQLQEAGYDIEQQDDSDPDRPCWSLQRNALRLENQALRQRIVALEQQAKELAESRDEQAKKTEQRERAIEALQANKEGLEQKLAELERQAKELAASRDEQAEKTEQRERAIEALQTDKEGLEQKIAELEQQAKELVESRDERAREAEERNQALEALQQEKEGLEKKIVELEKQNKELAQKGDAAQQAEQEASERLEAEIKRRKDEADARAKAEEKEQERSRQLADRQQEFQRLQADEAENKARESQIEEELTRAEAQIDLIKDLFLHEDRQ